ncbi:MAG: site-2 protease family protein [Patescibacteria group bacterium]
MIINLLFTEPIYFIAIFVALIISISLHEFAHVFTAHLLGDSTGERAGRLTLNPLAHLDMWGTISILLIGFGWGKPAPFNPYNLRAKRFGPALVALGGPLSNFLLIVVFGIMLKLLYPVLGPANYLTLFLSILVTFNGVLMIFNLIPIPPLDGSHILEGILGSRFANVSALLNRYGPQLLFGLIFLSIFFGLPIFSSIIYPIIRQISRALGVPILI